MPASRLEIVLCPLALLFHSARIYAFPCLTALVIQPLQLLQWALLQFLCCCKGSHCDGAFPATDASLDGVAPAGTSWRRPREFLQDKHPCLFGEGKIRADAVCQGGLGDCWLLSSIAALAERPGAIERLFISRRRNPRGKYSLRLFDGRTGSWRRVVVDDRLPCGEDGAPLFAAPRRNELWAPLLEKAFAKFCGSYAALDGGLMLFALEAMTGDHCFQLSQKDDGRWQRLDLRHAKDSAERGFKAQSLLYESNEDHPPDDIFKLMAQYLRRGGVLAAGTRGDDDTTALSGGLAAGHAYTVLDARKVAGFRLIKLRNPWGEYGEWTGEWSDRSECWIQHRRVAAQLKPSLEAGDSDGVFYMPFEAFCDNFTSLDVVSRHTGLDELQLDLHEDLGALGPCIGCCMGCAWFWCACQGCTKLYCSHESRDRTLEVRRSWWCCERRNRVARHSAVTPSR